MPEHTKKVALTSSNIKKAIRDEDLATIMDFAQRRRVNTWPYAGTLDLRPYTALQDAVSEPFPNPDIVKTLVYYGADINMCSSTYINTCAIISTPLVGAIRLIWLPQTVEIIRYLVQSGANLNIRDPHDFTLQTNRGELPIEIVERKHLFTMMLHNGAKINISDADGNTPAHNYKNQTRPLEYITALIEHGADLTKKNTYGTTVKHELRGSRIEQILQELEAYDKDNTLKENSEFLTSASTDEIIEYTRIALGQYPHLAHTILSNGNRHDREIPPEQYASLMRLAVRRYTNDATSAEHTTALKGFLDNCLASSTPDDAYHTHFINGIWNDIQHGLESAHVFGYMLRTYRNFFATYRDDNGNTIAHIAAMCPNLARYVPSSIILLTHDTDYVPVPYDKDYVPVQADLNDMPIQHENLRNTAGETPRTAAHHEHNHKAINACEQMRTIRRIFAYNKTKHGILYNTSYQGLPHHTINRIFAYLEIPHMH